METLEKKAIRPRRRIRPVTRHAIPVVYFTLRIISDHETTLKIIVVVLELTVFVVDHIIYSRKGKPE